MIRLRAVKVKGGLYFCKRQFDPLLPEKVQFQCIAWKFSRYLLKGHFYSSLVRCTISWKHESQFLLLCIPFVLLSRGAKNIGNKIVCGVDDVKLGMSLTHCKIWINSGGKSSHKKSFIFHRHKVLDDTFLKAPHPSNLLYASLEEAKRPSN